MSEAMQFNNGLTPEQNNEIDDLRIDMFRLISRVEALGRHRSYSITVTKLEEAAQWMNDRKHKAP